LFCHPDRSEHREPSWLLASGQLRASEAGTGSESLHPFSALVMPAADSMRRSAPSSTTAAARCFDAYAATAAAVRCFGTSPSPSTTSASMLERLLLLSMLPLKGLHLLRVLTLQVLLLREMLALSRLLLDRVLAHERLRFILLASQEFR
jgi:hypothetical protein